MKLFVSLAALNSDQWPSFIALLNTHVDGWHIDHTVHYSLPNLSKIRTYTDKPLWVHLMAPFPETEKLFPLTSTDFLTIQVELFKNINEFKSLSEQTPIPIGIAWAPQTPLSTIIPYLPHVPHITVMGVQPGASGQTFIDSTYARLAELYALCWQHHAQLKVFIDGGITPTICDQLPYQLLDHCAVGSFIANSADPLQAVQAFKRD